MPDFQNLVITDLPDASLTVNRFRIEVRVTDSQTGALLQDFTGPNALTFPGVLATLTARQRRTILRGLVRQIILMKTGDDDGSGGD